MIFDTYISRSRIITLRNLLIEDERHPEMEAADSLQNTYRESAVGCHDWVWLEAKRVRARMGS